MDISFVGGGLMAEALIGGIIESKIAAPASKLVMDWKGPFLMPLPAAFYASLSTHSFGRVPTGKVCSQVPQP